MLEIEDHEGWEGEVSPSNYIAGLSDNKFGCNKQFRGEDSQSGHKAGLLPLHRSGGRRKWGSVGRRKTVSLGEFISF